MYDYLQINTNTAIDADHAAERTPIAYYENNGFCIQDVFGSSWVLANFFTNQFETDLNMQVKCS